MSICAAIIGAGRMGTIVAKKMPQETKKIIIDTDAEKARELAENVGGTSSPSLDAAKEADLIAIVLPAPVVNGVIASLIDVVKKGAVIINMATNGHVEAEIKGKNKDVTIADAKIIGHAASIAKGEPGIVVVNCYDEKEFRLVESQLQGFDKVVAGNSDLVEKINQISSTEGIKAAVKVRTELRNMGVNDKEWINVAIRTVCAGTMKSFTENDLGHFGKELVKKLEAENNN